MHPVFDEWDAGEGFRLGQFVLVMRKLQIEAAAVDVERLAQQLHAHRGAFDVPARTSLAPGAVPERLARLGPLPQGEVAGIALLVADLDAGPGFQLLRIAMAQLAVIAVPAHVEIDVPPHGIGKFLGDQTLNHLDDVADVVRRPGHVIDAGHVEPGQVLAIIGRDALGQLRHGRLEFPGLDDELVVNVGDVDDEGDRVAGIDEIAFDGIEDDGADHVAQMAGLVDRRPAHVHRHLARLDGLEGFLLLE